MRGQLANFSEANLSGSSITANLTGASFVNADLGDHDQSLFSFSESNLTMPTSPEQICPARRSS